MKTLQIAGRNVTVHEYNTVIVGAGAAGMNCAVHLVEFMAHRGIGEPHKRIAIVTAGRTLGASRMSGSDKQTYYKMGTAAETPDSAVEFAKSLTAAGCCHEDLALIEAIGSLREFYHLVQAGVPFPHDAMGSYIGYKTDHDPYERATSAGPKTSKFMSECLEAQVRRYGVALFDHMEVAELLAQDQGPNRRLIGVAALDRQAAAKGRLELHVFCCRNLVLAAGGPGELYETSVYPKGQTGLHGLAFRAGLVAENLTESQFGLASTKFRWNVSGTYMQAIPRIFSTDADGGDERDFLPPYFDSLNRMATDIFLKGYQWPFDPQRIENQQSSLIDVLVFNETQKGRRVFLDFRRNPVGGDRLQPFKLDELELEAVTYLRNAGAVQLLPIERLAHMNPPAIEIYAEHGIDLHTQPLEIAVCAQHNNGGFAVDTWWQSSIPGTFVIGEMAGTHGVKRPGGSALNAGQTGGLRAAEYIAHACDPEPLTLTEADLRLPLAPLLERLDRFTADKAGPTPREIQLRIQRRMTQSGGHIRRLVDAKRALAEALDLHRDLTAGRIAAPSATDLPEAIRVEHLALASVAYLKAIVELLQAGGGSRGSHLVLDEEGIEVHPDVLDPGTGRPLRFKPENLSLRDSVLRVQYEPQAPDLFTCRAVSVRRHRPRHQAFEPAWAAFREGRIYQT